MTVGQTVARARVTAGLTVEDVALATRVRGTVVSAIENDDFTLCGGDVYARGHLKSIATAVGLDPVAVATQFDAERGRSRAANSPVAPIEQPTRVMEITAKDTLGALASTLGTSVRIDRRGVNWTALMSVAAAIVIIIGAYSFLTHRSTATQELAGAGSSPTTHATSPAASPSVTPTSTAKATPTHSPTASTPGTGATPDTATTAPGDVVAQADGVLVSLAVNGKASWIRATTGTGTTLFEGTLSAGDTKVFRDKSKIKLLIGNAGAVTLKVNGHDLGSPGNGGQVVKLTFVPGDPTATTA